MPVPSPALKRSRGASPSDSVTYGDINGTGSVTAADALLAQKAFLGHLSLNERQKKAADVNGDGMVNATDALLIEKRALGEIEQFPVEKEEKEPQRVRNLRADIASLETQIASLRPFDELPPWRRRRLSRAIALADEANVLVEREETFTEAKTKFDEALRLFKDDSPPDNPGGGPGLTGNGSGANGSGSNGSGGTGGGSGPSDGPDQQMIAGVDDTTLVLGAGVAATGLIALVASS